MDSTDLQPGEPRRRTSSMALLAAGSLTGLVLGLGGMAFAETPVTSDTGSSSAQQTAPADEDGVAQQDAATEDGAAADELCDEPGGRGGTGDSAPDDSAGDDSTADDSAGDGGTDGSADPAAGTTSAA